MATYAQVLADIQQWIIANNNNEITANVLRPILEDMLAQPNTLIGDLNDLGTNNRNNIVAALNEIITKADASITVHVGSGTPFETPPALYEVTDFYVQDNAGIQGMWIYNGSQWIKIFNAGNQTPTEIDFGAVPTAGDTTTIEEIASHINGIGFSVGLSELLVLKVTITDGGTAGIEASYFFGGNGTVGDWGTGTELTGNGEITTDQLLRNYREQPKQIKWHLDRQNFPTTGEEDIAYVDFTNGKLYLWDTAITDYRLLGGSEYNLTAQKIEAALGYTPESTDNKAVDFSVQNNTLYPTILAVVNYINAQGFLTEEADPTVASFIKAITSQQIANWDAAFNWGNHAQQGYLTTVTQQQVLNALGFTPENVANKAVDFTVTNDTLYPSVKAVVDYITAQGFLTAITAQMIIDALGYTPADKMKLEWQVEDSKDVAGFIIHGVANDYSDFGTKVQALGASGGWGFVHTLNGTRRFALMKPEANGIANLQGDYVNGRLLSDPLGDASFLTSSTIYASKLNLEQEITADIGFGVETFELYILGDTNFTTTTGDSGAYYWLRRYSKGGEGTVTEADLEKFVRVDQAQTFTVTEQNQGRANIDAARKPSVFTANSAPTTQQFAENETNTFLTSAAGVNYVMPTSGMLPEDWQILVKTTASGTINFSVEDATVSIEYNDVDAVGLMSQRAEAWILFKNNIYYINGEVS